MDAATTGVAPGNRYGHPAWSEMARSQSWDPIVSMLSSRSPEMSEAVARMRFNVSESWECQSSIPWKKAVKRLLACLDSDPTGVALGKYSADPGQLLKSGGQGREAAVGALVKLSEEKSAAGVVISQGATDALAVFLLEAPSSRQLPIMETLPDLARSSNFHFTWRAIIQTLIDLLKVRSGEVVLGAAKCLASILNERPHLHQNAVNGGLLFGLENMLMESWPQKRAAVTLLAKVSDTDTCKASFKRMDSVVRMLPSVSLEGKNCIAGIAGDLVTNQANA
ncbi:hypothetical protein BSKO_04583 [Bryopsis sp. KO-2023]|nr:hypothetical protein BSKO_04583 [Bryopsis sp. KO-2023]